MPNSKKKFRASADRPVAPDHGADVGSCYGLVTLPFESILFQLQGTGAVFVSPRGVSSEAGRILSTYYQPTSKYHPREPQADTRANGSHAGHRKTRNDWGRTQSYFPPSSSPIGLVIITTDPSLDLQTHSEKLVHSAAVNLNVEFGSFKVLSELCLKHGITPGACMLSDKTDFKIDRLFYKSNDPTDHRTGGTGGRTGDTVYVKLLRLHSRSERKLVAVKQMFHHEAAKWKRISHPNLVSVLEVSDASVRGLITFSVITPWLPGGNVAEYLQKHQGADRLKLLVQAACGLEHLHSLGIIHSNINPGNILVSENGQACLGDFGVTQIISGRTITGPERLMSSKSNACRYMPPELLDLECDRCNHSEASDIYSLAMTSFEVLTGIVPYKVFREDTIPFHIVKGERPVRPTEPTETQWLSDPLWEMLEDCWNEDPELRWEVLCVRHRFSNPTTARVQGIPCVGGALRPTGFEVQLNQLRADDCPKYLAKCLTSALKERPVHEQDGLNLEPRSEGVKVLFEVFDKVLVHRPFDSLISKRFRQLCGRGELVSFPYTISSKRISTFGKHPVASGGFGDIWKGVCDGRHVAIKALRVYKNDDMRKVKRVFYKEVTMWKRLSHPNIVPFLGVTDTPAPLSIVLEWMPNGDIRQFVKQYPGVDRLQLLLDVCHGLQVLHTHNTVHGDLKGANILINNSGWACLTDFGLSSTASLSCTESSAHGACTSFRWTAPELLRITESQPDRPTEESDIYALAMVAIEVFTGLIPFESCKADPTVMLKVINGERPTRPAEATKLGLTDGLWELIQSAWAQDAQRRPPVKTIVDFLLRAT